MPRPLTPNGRKSREWNQDIAEYTEAALTALDETLGETAGKDTETAQRGKETFTHGQTGSSRDRTDSRHCRHARGTGMTTDERQAAIDQLKQICRDIGCSGLYPDMCQNRPHHCTIIRKIVAPKGVVMVDGMYEVKQ